MKQDAAKYRHRTRDKVPINEHLPRCIHTSTCVVGPYLPLHFRRWTIPQKLKLSLPLLMACQLVNLRRSTACRQSEGLKRHAAPQVITSIAIHLRHRWTLQKHGPRATYFSRRAQCLRDWRGWQILLPKSVR